MSLRQHDPYVAFGGKIDPITDIRNAGIITNGNVYWVSNSGDAQHTTRVEAYGRGVVKLDIQTAIDKTVTDNNDYVFIIPQDSNGTWSAGTAIDLDKDRLKLIGLGYTRSKNSYSVTIEDSMGTTPDTELLYVTGNACEVAGIRFVGTLGTNDGGTMTNGVAYLSAHDFWAHDAVFENTQDLWGTPPVVAGAGTAAHDARFDDCVFAVTGTAVESAGNAPLVAGGAGNKRWIFNDSIFKIFAGSVTETIFSTGVGAKEYTMFNRCHFGLVNGTGFAITSAIRGSVEANSPVLVNDTTVIGFTQVGTDPNVYVSPAASGTRAAIYNPYMAIGSAVVVAA